MSNNRLPDLSAIKASNILLIAVDTLDYDVFIERFCENNPVSNNADDAKKEIPEDEFKRIKKDLAASIALAGLQEIAGALGDFFKAMADPSNVSGVDLKSMKTFATAESPKPPDPKPDDAKHVKLTGQPVIDTEIIFNMIKNHNK